MNKKLIIASIALASISISLCAVVVTNSSRKVFAPAEAASYSLTLTIPNDSSGSKTIKTTKGNNFKYSYDRDYDSIYNNTSIKSITGITCTYSGNGTAVLCLSYSSSHPTINSCDRKTTLSSGSKYTTSGYHYFTIVVDPELWVDINISKVVVNYSC